MKTPSRRIWLFALLLALAVAFLSPLASSHPDGLERIAEDQGFIQQAQDAPFEIIPDYVLPGVENEAVATILAGVIGALLVAGLAWGLAWLVHRSRAAA